MAATRNESVVVYGVTCRKKCFVEEETIAVAWFAFFKYPLIHPTLDNSKIKITPLCYEHGGTPFNYREQEVTTGVYYRKYNPPPPYCSIMLYTIGSFN